MPRLQGLIPALVLLVMCLAAPARAGVIFTPHVSEYARQAPGPYSDFSLTLSRIEDVYDRNGDKVPLGSPFVRPGEQLDVALLTYKALWVGHPFRDSGIFFLEDHELFCRAIFTLGWQQASAGVGERGRKFGFSSGASGPGDIFGLCGVYGKEHRWRALKFNGLFSNTVKFPVGRYDRDALVNTGTNYWTTIPQLGLHAEYAGRLYVDGTLAWQINGNNDDPAYGGLTPTRPADVRNAEVNLAWKFSEHWFADLGFSFRETVGRNRYDGVNVATAEPVEAEQACDTLGLDPVACSATRQFLLRSQPGSYSDDGIEGTIVTAGFNYVYRSSSVFTLRALIPVQGRGAQLDIPFDLYAAVPDPLNPGRFVASPGPPLLQTTSTLTAVQEAASVAASPLLELRFVYLFWSP